MCVLISRFYLCVCVCVTEKGWWGKSWPSWLNLTLPPHHHFQVRASSYLVSLPHSALRTTRSILHALLIRPGKKKQKQKKTLLPGVWDFTGKKMEDTSDNVKQNPDHHFKKKKERKKKKLGVGKQIWTHYFFYQMEHHECPLEHEPAVTKRTKQKKIIPR